MGPRKSVRYNSEGSKSTIWDQKREAIFVRCNRNRYNQVIL